MGETAEPPSSGRRKRLDEDAKRRLVAAIESIEARSGAEVVVSIKAQSDGYLHAGLWAGIASGVAALTFLLYSNFEFALHWFVIDPVVVGIAVALAVHYLPPARRALTPATWRRQKVAHAAHAAFHTRGVRMTKERVGILVYLSMLESDAEIIADQGVLDAVGDRTWNRAAREVVEAFRGGTNWRAMAAKIESLGEVLAPAIPITDDDIDELPNEVHHD